MTRAHPKGRRHRWLVNRPLQLRFLKAIALVLCLMALLAVAAVYVAAWWTLASFELLEDAAVVAVVKCICWVLLLELILVAPFVLWWWVHLTHHVAGPLVRIHEALRYLARGEAAPRIRLRAGDEMHELAELVNTLKPR